MSSPGARCAVSSLRQPRTYLTLDGREMMLWDAPAKFFFFSVKNCPTTVRVLRTPGFLDSWGEGCTLTIHDKYACLRDLSEAARSGRVEVNQYARSPCLFGVFVVRNFISRAGEILCRPLVWVRSRVGHWHSY